jgi:hypothetical protein
MLKCWREVPGYENFVRDKWQSLEIDGCGGHVLKENLRQIKGALREWHAAHSQNLPSRIDALNARLSILDVKAEEEALSEAELESSHGISLDIYSLSRLNASICWQQSRSTWLREGDAKTKYFHYALARRRQGNTISALQVDGVIVEGVQHIRQAVFSHFESHFKADRVDRPGVENLVFKRLNQVDCGSLTRPFLEVEVKDAVWDCDSFKSPGPDDVNFGFFRDFWPELKGDVMHFMSEFHRNGKLTRALIPPLLLLSLKSTAPNA